MAYYISKSTPISTYKKWTLKYIWKLRFSNQKWFSCTPQNKDNFISRELSQSEERRRAWNRNIILVKKESCLCYLHLKEWSYVVSLWHIRGFVSFGLVHINRPWAARWDIFHAKFLSLSQKKMRYTLRIISLSWFNDHLINYSIF